MRVMKAVINEDWGNLLLQEVKRLKGEPKSKAGSSQKRDYGRTSLQEMADAIKTF